MSNPNTLFTGEGVGTVGKGVGAKAADKDMHWLRCAADCDYPQQW